MRTKPILAVWACCVLVAAGQALAAPASPLGWLGLSNSKTTRAKTSEVSQSSSAAPAALTRMSDGTKRLVSNTKKMFTPEKPPAKRRGVTATHRAQSPEQPKQNFFQRLFYAEPPPPPKTVNEWMRLKQVRP